MYSEIGVDNRIINSPKLCGMGAAVMEKLEKDILEEYFPNERKQCENIWKHVYDEYRRIGYRLKPIEAERYE